MKLRTYFSIFTAFALLTANVFAGNRVTTGKVTAVDPKAGTMTVLSDQTRRPIDYTALSRTPVQFGSGKVATLADVAVGQAVTVEYATVGKNIAVAKVMIPNPESPAAPVARKPLTPGERSGLTSPAALDDDITTQPGSKARTDNDITTRAGSKARIDNDITTQPGRKARTDNDITTQPGKKVPGDGDITKKAGN